MMLQEHREADISYSPISDIGEWMIWCVVATEASVHIGLYRSIYTTVIYFGCVSLTDILQSCLSRLTLTSSLLLFARAIQFVAFGVDAPSFLGLTSHDQRTVQGLEMSSMPSNLMSWR